MYGANGLYVWKQMELKFKNKNKHEKTWKRLFHLHIYDFLAFSVQQWNSSQPIKFSIDVEENPFVIPARSRLHERWEEGKRRKTCPENKTNLSDH